MKTVFREVEDLNTSLDQAALDCAHLHQKLKLLNIMEIEDINKAEMIF